LVFGSVQRCVELGIRVAALEGGSFLVCGRASSSGAGRCHGREGGMVLGERCDVGVARVSSWRWPAPYVGGSEACRGETLAHPWAAVSASADVVSFLKAPLW
jgi:hypothetical protein